MADVLPIRPEFAPDLAARSAPARRPVGEELVRSGALDPEALIAALKAQETQDQRLGRILLSEEKITDAELAAALARQSGLALLDLEDTPADGDLVRGFDPYRSLDMEAVPWRRHGAVMVVALGNPDAAEVARELFAGEGYELGFAIAPPAQIRRTIETCCAHNLEMDARLRCPEALSCRAWTARTRQGQAWIAAGALAACAASAPVLALQILMCWVVLANAATTGLRLAALFARFRRTPPASERPDAPRLADYRKLPRVSILVPLLREEAVAERLLGALAAMDYPAPLLDVKLVLEIDDVITRAAIERTPLPRTIEIITVPHDTLRTKPRAMNYALPFCEGEIVGIYDAEDRPDPGQIREVVAHLQSAPPAVGCVQGYLDFYNADRNWLSRCFALEYAMWFRVILKGVQMLGLPIPLGGTTVFFRRRVLEEVGGWDAHNVTEDADLGMRMARFGYRCEMIPSTTLEEANCRTLPWIRQRSRWLKGYAITWATHMRRPARLWADLGAKGFLGFQVLFLGAITAYLAIPLFWAILLSGTALEAGFWSTLPRWMMWSFAGSMIAGQAVMLSIAVIAARDSRRPHLIPWVLTLAAYWPLGAIAAYKAIAEIFTRPSYWHKTEHGIAFHNTAPVSAG